MPSRTADRLRLVGAALLFSTGGAAIKATTFTGPQVASLRSGVAALAILALAPAARRGWSPRAALVALAYAVTLTLFAAANKLTTSANAIFLQSTAPIYLVLLSPLLLREPVRRRDLAVMAAIAGGLALFFVGAEAPVATAPDPVRGNALALASGVTYALLVAGLRWMGAREGDHAVAAVAIGNLLGFGLALPAALPFARVTPTDVVAVLYLGVFQIAVAYLLLAQALRRVPALEASMLLLVEPVFNPVWAWLVHGERPGPWALAGGAVIIAATTAQSVLAARRDDAGAPAAPAGEPVIPVPGE